MLQHLPAEVCLGETIITKIKAIRFFTGFQLCAHNPTVQWVPGGRIPIRTTKYKSWCLAIPTDNRHHNTNTHVHGIYTFIYIYIYMYIYTYIFSPTCWTEYFITVGWCQYVLGSIGTRQIQMLFVWPDIFQRQSTKETDGWQEHIVTAIHVLV